MRFKEEKKPKEGTTKIVKEFLLLPLTIGDETRWLESTKIRLRFYHNKHIGGGWGSGSGWFYDSWVD